MDQLFDLPTLRLVINELYSGLTEKVEGMNQRIGEDIVARGVSLLFRCLLLGLLLCACILLILLFRIILFLHLFIRILYFL